MKVVKIIGKVIVCIFAVIGAVVTSATMYGISRWGFKPYYEAANDTVDDLNAGYYD